MRKIAGNDSRIEKARDAQCLSDLLALSARGLEANQGIYQQSDMLVNQEASTPLTMGFVLLFAKCHRHGLA